MGGLILAASAIILNHEPALRQVESHLLPPPPGIELRTKEKKRSANEYIEHLWNMRANRETGTIDPAWVHAAREQHNLLKSQGHRGSLNLQWETMGPNNFGGRTRAILIDPTNPNRMYTGGVMGGLWISNSAGKSWFPYIGDDTLGGIGVVSLCRTTNGDIYVGTGEGQVSFGGTTFGTTGFLGEGIWKSEDGGTTFKHLPTTRPAGNHNQTVDWSFVNALAAHPTDPNIVFAGARGKIFRTTDGGQTWPAVTLSPGAGSTLVEDIKVDPDGITYAAIGGFYYRGNINGDQIQFQRRNGMGGFPNTGASRYIFAIAPSDPKYVYAIGCNGQGQTRYILQSIDHGENWVSIAPVNLPSTVFNPTGGQGGYDMEIAVHPADKELIYIGGQLSVYTGRAINTSGNVSWSFYPVSNWFSSTTFDNQYIHADHHEIVFHPTNPDVMYVGTDGGIFQTKEARKDHPQLPPFTQLNKGYNVAQFYSVAAGLDGSVVGGTQDNGTIYVDFSGNTLLQGRGIMGGDGGFADISKWNPKAIFGESQFGALRRSANSGAGMAPFYDHHIDGDNDGVPGDGANPSSPFITAFRLWEEFDKDTLNYVYYRSIADTVIESALTPSRYDKMDSLIIIGSDTMDVAGMRHTYQGEGRIAIGTNNTLWIGTNVLDFSKESSWYDVGKAATGFSGTASSMDWSVDGDVLYVGTSNGQVYRIDGLRHAYMRYDTFVTGVPSAADVFDTATAGIGITRIASFGGTRYVCEVAVDKNNPDHVVVTLGNYGNTAFVYRCTTATTAPAATNPGEFFSIQGSGATMLPRMPVYSCLVDYYNSNNIIVGTELGIYSSSNGGLTWASEMAGMPATPVFMLRQEMFESIESGCYVIYAGSHGRGFWRTTTLTPGTCNTALAIAQPENRAVGSVQLFPNPASDYTTLAIDLNDPQEIWVRIYDMRGRVMGSFDWGSLPSGDHRKVLPLGNYGAGTYIVMVGAGTEKMTRKLVVTF